MTNILETKLILNIIIVSGSIFMALIFIIIKKIYHGKKKKVKKAKDLHDGKRRNSPLEWIDNINPDANPLYNPSQRDEDFTESFFQHPNSN